MGNLENLHPSPTSSRGTPTRDSMYSNVPLFQSPTVVVLSFLFSYSRAALGASQSCKALPLDLFRGQLHSKCQCCLLALVGGATDQAVKYARYKRIPRTNCTATYEAVLALRAERELRRRYLAVHLEEKEGI